MLVESSKCREMNRANIKQNHFKKNPKVFTLGFLINLKTSQIKD